MLNLLKRLWKEEEGQAMTEYGLILGVIAIAVIAALFLMRPQLVAIYDSITASLTQASTP
ncbi:Flp family type IVb pilin [Zhaonella formicivorans]|uniref:Flp family type IVb pilin n=1 Tax=Zhaonella formicivorans TaxID=2528593 RepID=UPI0010D5364C|nr:Flp family type IVb pilin [Zhaonella formicivorans]